MPNEDALTETPSVPPTDEVEYIDEEPLDGVEHFTALADDFPEDAVIEDEVAPVVEEVETEDEPETTEEDETPPPPSFALELPADMFTAAEMSDIETAQGSYDPIQQARANIFIARRVAQYEARAASAAQEAYNSVPEPLRAIHGPAINHFLTQICEPHRRNTPEAMIEAQIYGLFERAKQLGNVEKAIAEAARLIAAPQTARPITAAPSPKAVIPADKRTPTSSVQAPAARTPVHRSRVEAERQKLQDVLGYDLSELRG